MSKCVIYVLDPGEKDNDKNLKTNREVSSSKLDKFELEALTRANQLRSDHQTTPLKWSEELAQDARRWAKDVAKKRKMSICPESDQGENLFCCRGYDPTGIQVVDKWYEESAKYDFKKPNFNKTTGNFTQLLWANSSEFGIGKAKAEDGSVYVVGRFCPHGNVGGQFVQNVKPKKS